MSITLATFNIWFNEYKWGINLYFHSALILPSQKSNNINLVDPRGQFGTRLQGGADSASERYIFTQLNKITRSLFPQQDDNILKYLNDETAPGALLSIALFSILPVCVVFA